MSFTQVISSSYSDGGTPIVGRVTVVSDGMIPRDIEVPAATSNKPVDVTAVQARIVSVFLLSDKAVTLKTNDFTTPTDSIPLAAGVPRIWATGLGACPFTGDIDGIFLSHAGSGIANVQIRIGYDSTP